MIVLVPHHVLANARFTSTKWSRWRVGGLTPTQGTNHGTPIIWLPDVYPVFDGAVVSTSLPADVAAQIVNELEDEQDAFVLQFRTRTIHATMQLASALSADPWNHIADISWLQWGRSVLIKVGNDFENEEQALTLVADISSRLRDYDAAILLTVPPLVTMPTQAADTYGFVKVLGLSRTLRHARQGADTPLPTEIHSPTSPDSAAFRTSLLAFGRTCFSNPGLPLAALGIEGRFVSVPRQSLLDHLAAAAGAPVVSALTVACFSEGGTFQVLDVRPDLGALSLTVAGPQWSETSLDHVCDGMQALISAMAGHLSYGHVTFGYDVSRMSAWDFGRADRGPKEAAPVWPKALFALSHGSLIDVFPIMLAPTAALQGVSAWRQVEQFANTTLLRAPRPSSWWPVSTDDESQQQILDTARHQVVLSD